MMKPVEVDSNQCHLWTDALHARALAREAQNKWDRGTYVRFCVMISWIALEAACQDALDDHSIGYNFKDNLDRALKKRDCQPIKWGEGLWQKVGRVQSIRNDYVHRYRTLSEKFPSSSVADDAITIIRDAIKSIYLVAGKSHPEWVELCDIKGWDTPSQDGPFCIAQGHFGATFDDPNNRKIFIVVNGEEKLTAVFPMGHDTAETVAQLLTSVKIPIEAIRVYEAGALVESVATNMRGS